jgi:hypothetical protein
LRYTDFENNPQLITKKRYLQWQPGSQTPELVTERHQKKLWAIATINQALKVMAEAYAQGHNDQALQTLLSTRTQMQQLFPQADDKDVKKLINELDIYVRAFTQQKRNTTRH